MKVVPIKGFPHDRRGQMLAGKVYEVDEAEGKRLMSLRLVRQASPDEYETKVVGQKPVAGPIPSPAVGEMQPSSASQAAQASPQTTAKPSERGGKKRGKKKRGE